MKPKISISHDEHERKAEELFKNFQDTENNDVLLKCADEYLKSQNPEKEGIYHILKSLYHRRVGISEKDHERALLEFKKSREHLLKISKETDEEVKTLALEVVNRKLRMGEKKDKKLLRELFFEAARLNRELGKERSYHANMALYHMYGIFENLESDEKLVQSAQLMVKEAELSGEEELFNKAKSLFHHVKAGVSRDPETALKELEIALEATKKTKDGHGKEDTEAEILYIKGLMTPEKKKRDRLVREAGIKWMATGNKKKVIEAAKMLTPLPMKVLGIIEMIEATIQKQNELLSSVRKMASKPEGSYMLFYHHSYLIERLKDFEKIITRLGKARKRLTELGIARNKYQPKSFRRKLSKKLQAIAQEQSDLTHSMRLDLESLYVFGKILIDQWAFTIGYLLGHDRPELLDFQRLSDGIMASNKDRGKFQIIWDRHHRDIFWLYYQLKAYRNEFIEHVKRPWQKGTTMSVIGDDFNLFIPTPPGYFSQKEIEKKLKSVRHLMPKALKEMPDGYWEKTSLKRTLEVTFHRIDEIRKKEDREKVWKVWSEIGGSTPSYDKVAIRLINYLYTSTDTVREIVEKNLASVDLGETVQKPISQKPSFKSET